MTYKCELNAVGLVLPEVQNVYFDQLCGFWALICPKKYIFETATIFSLRCTSVYITWSKSKCPICQNKTRYPCSCMICPIIYFIQILFCPKKCSLSGTGGTSSTNFLDPCVLRSVICIERFIHMRMVTSTASVLDEPPQMYTL